MQRRKFTSATSAAIALAAFGPVAKATSGISESDAALGIRTALERGAVAAVGQLGRADGFLGNEKVRIELPGFLHDVARFLKAAGQQRRLDELVVAMNRAAEAAVPEAKALLVNAVKSMSVEDARKILSGGDDSATQFFAQKTREPLGVKFLPIVMRAMQKVSLADKYNAVTGKAASLGLLKKDDSNVQQYVTTRALDGLYLMIGDEERKIRKDPIGTGSAILKKIFGSLK